jgi:uncharacterized protein YlxW (UPF0749 family)
MNMKKFLLFAGMIIGVMIAVQFNSELLANKSSAINEKTDMELMLQELHQEQNELSSALQQVREEELNKLTTLDETLQSTLSSAQENAGLVSMNGSGLILKLKSKKSLSFADQASYLRDITNLLFNLHVKAFSINGYRVVFKTPILAVQNNILIQNFHISGPFEIKIIGNADFILSAIEVKEGLADFRNKIKDKTLYLEVQRQDDIQIPAYI